MKSAYLRFPPPSLHSWLSMLGRLDTKLLRWEYSRALHTSSSEQWSKGSRFILRLPEKRTGSWEGGEGDGQIKQGPNVSSLAFLRLLIGGRVIFPHLSPSSVTEVKCGTEASADPSSPCDIGVFHGHTSTFCVPTQSGSAVHQVLLCITKAGQCPRCTHLWYDGDSGAEVMETHFTNVHSIDEDASLVCLDDTKQPQCKGGLASSSATHNPHLMHRWCNSSRRQFTQLHTPL